jgi:hypothetical protein
LAILTALTLRTVPRLAYRQAEGLISSIISSIPEFVEVVPKISLEVLLGLTLRVPDHTTLSRRSATWAVPRPQPTAADDDDDARPVHLLVDSTGLG